MECNSKPYKLVRTPWFGMFFFLLVLPVSLPAYAADAIFVDTNASVGMGTNSPAKQLHVQGSDTDTGSNNTVAFMAENISGTTAARQLFTLNNNGPIGFGMVNTDTTDEWRFAAQTTGFRVSLGGSGGPEFEVEKDGSVRAGGGSSFVMNLDGSTGDMTIDGTLTEGSSRAFKTAIDSIDPSVILGKLSELPLAEWSYKKGDMSRHLGPMAEDFYRLFGLGPDEQHIAPKDLAGVAMASAKALYKETNDLRSELEKKEKRVEKLEKTQKALKAKAERVDELEARLDRLETRVSEKRD